LNVANQLWHTDGTYGRPRADISFLLSRVVPPRDGETEYCDTRHAYDLLSAPMRERVNPLFAYHSITHSRTLTGSKLEDWDPLTLNTFPPVRRPVVHIHAGSGRKALCVASHIETIEGYTYEESQQLVHYLIDIATGPGCVYTHEWQVGDLLLWDNTCAMHRVRPYDDFVHVRQLVGTRTERGRSTLPTYNGRVWLSSIITRTFRSAYLPNGSMSRSGNPTVETTLNQWRQSAILLPANHPLCVARFNTTRLRR